MVVKGCPYGDDRHGKRVAILVCEDLLARTTQADKRDGVSRGSDPPRVLVFLLRRCSPDLGKLRPRNDEPRETLVERSLKPTEDRLGAAVQVDRNAHRGRNGADLEHERGAVHTVNEPRAMKEVQGPANRLPVRGHEVEMVEPVSVDPVLIPWTASADTA